MEAVGFCWASPLLHEPVEVQEWLCSCQPEQFIARIGDVGLCAQDSHQPEQFAADGQTFGELIEAYELDWRADRAGQDQTDTLYGENGVWHLQQQDRVLKSSRPFIVAKMHRNGRYACETKW